MLFQLKRSPVNYLALVGICLSFFGSFLLAFDANPYVHGVTATLTGYDKVEKGWQTLTTFKFRDNRGDSIAVLGNNDEGFQQILHVILINRQEYLVQKTIAIVNSNPIGLKIGSGDVSPRAISLLADGESNSNGVASEETVKQWIDSDRRSELLSFAARFIFVGFFISLIAQFFQVKIRPKRTLPNPRYSNILNH